MATWSPFRHGLIPAHAGKTLPRRDAAHRRRAHPRSRGENQVATFPLEFRAGSSPLTRGKRSGDHRRTGPDRLIPAHAGKTGLKCCDTHAPKAHPRSRGENAYAQNLNKRGSGSSPLTRGKRAHDHRLSPPLRLIPAHAGKTADQPYPPASPAAHPRSRGENIAAS